MPLSDSFPPELIAQHHADKEGLCKAQIIPGAVIRLFSNHSTPPKLKRFLVVNTAPLQLFIVSTEIFARYLNTQKWAIPYQIPVAPDGACFHNDCYIDCANFWDEFELEEMICQCIAGTCEVLGNVPDTVCMDVCSAISECRTFSAPEVSAVTANLA